MKQKKNKITPKKLFVFRRKFSTALGHETTKTTTTSDPTTTTITTITTSAIF